MTKSSSYRPDIDGLRAVAVLSVLFYHAHVPGFGGGFVGVDVFFVISGYLITGLLLTELERTGRISLSRFYVRRLRRLVPSLVVMLGATLAGWLYAFRFLEFESENFFKSIGASVWGLANLFFFAKTGGYFDPAVDDLPLLHLWSLGIEEQFYFVWPLTLWGLTAFSRRCGRDVRGGALLGLSFASLALAQWYVSRDLTRQAFYLPLPRAWELGVGALLAAGKGSRRAVSPRASSVLSALALGLLVACITILSSRLPFPGVSALLPTLATAVLIFVGRGGSPITRGLAHAPWPQIGIISYALYLWHWPILVFIKLESSRPPTVLQNLSGLGLATVLAWVSTRFIEPRFRKVAARDLGANLKLIGTCLGAALVITITMNNLGRLVRKTYPARLRAMLDLVNEPNFPPGVVEHHHCEMNIDAIRHGDCSVGNVDPDASKHRHLFVVGNSFAWSTLPMISEVAKLHHARSTLYFAPWAFFLGYDHKFFFESEAKTKARLQFAEDVLADISDLRHRDPRAEVSVLFVHRWPAFDREATTNRWQPHFAKNEHDDPEVYEKSLALSVDRLEAAGVHRIGFLKPTPGLTASFAKCVSKFTEGRDCGGSREDNVRDRRVVGDMIDGLVERHPGFVTAIDPLPWVCDDRWCPTFLRDSSGRWIPVVKDDGDHVSMALNRHLLPRLEKPLGRLFE